MPQRQSIRLHGYDYAKTGAYFVTICIRNQACLMGKIADGEMVLNRAGQMAESVWVELPARFSNIQMDEFTIMPNHFHGIVIIQRRGESCIRPRSGTGDHQDRPYGTLPESISRIVQAFKSISTGEYIRGVKSHDWSPFPGKLWQRNYYDHIVRDDDELAKIREYIKNNPLKWEFDKENPAALNLTNRKMPEESWMI